MAKKTEKKETVKNVNENENENLNVNENENLNENAPEVEKEKTSVAKKEELIEVLIPEDKLNPKDTEVIVGINDKYAKIERGKPTQVSRAVWEQLRNAKLV